MYCVKCGRECAKTEKRCPDCGMHLVTPSKLRELIELEKITNMTFTGRLRNGYKRFKKRWRRRLNALGDALEVFFSRLSVDLKALLLLLGRMLKAAGNRLWKFLKRASVFIRKYAIIGWKRAKVLAKRAGKRLSQKVSELKQQYRQEKENQRHLLSEKGAQTRTRTMSAARSANARTVARSRGTSASSRAAARKTSGNTQKARRNTYARSDKPRDPFSPRTQPSRESKRGLGASAKNASRKRAAKRANFFARVFTAEWAQEHLRSLVAMGLLLLALVIFSFWGAFSDSGQKTLAQIGLGSARGYLLIGDDYMGQNNYSRAVEYYYTSLTKDLSYDAALKLAIAYSYTGDVSKEISALLICTENYPQNKLPFTQLYQLYPEGSARPARVQQAIEQGIRLYGSL